MLFLFFLSFFWLQKFIAQLGLMAQACNLSHLSLSLENHQTEGLPGQLNEIISKLKTRRLGQHGNGAKSVRAIRSS